MMILKSFFIGLMIVVGQGLWKVGISKIDPKNSVTELVQNLNFKFLLSPWIIAGALVYALATILYIVMLSKYEYASLQTLVVSSSLVFTFLASAVLFGEKINIVNIFGLILLILSITLIVKY